MLTTISGNVLRGPRQRFETFADVADARQVAPPNERVGIVVVQFAENRARRRAVSQYADALERDRFVESASSIALRAPMPSVSVPAISRPKKIVLTASARCASGLSRAHAATASSLSGYVTLQPVYPCDCSRRIDRNGPSGGT